MDVKEAQVKIDKLRKLYPCEKELEDLLDRRLMRRDCSETGWTGVKDPMGSLENFFRQYINGPFKIEHMKRLSGGGANESYSFTLTDGHLWQAGRRLVLRVKQPGGICPVHAAREFQMLSVASKFLPAPEPLYLADDLKYFGAPAFIMSCNPGTSVPVTNTTKATGLGVAYPKELREKLAPKFVEYCAKLHAYDWSKDDLSLFDKPKPGTSEANVQRVNFWSRTWHQDKVEAHPTMMLMEEWLKANLPTVDKVSLLHGDYRNGNFLFNEEEGKINCVIDWELCSLGDRHSDLAYTMLPGWGSLDENGTWLVAGLMPRETFISEYERISGLKIDPVRLKYFSVLAYYWGGLALMGSGPMNAMCNITQNDVMYNFISGLGGRFFSDANKIILEDVA